MRDILISSAVCLACLLVALASQLVAPTPVQARDSQTVAVVAAAPAAAAAPGELDPDDANPQIGRAHV